MVNGAFLEPNMGTPLRSVILALVGASSWGCCAAGLACCRSSNCRIWRSSCRICSPCWRVRPPWSLAIPGPTWAASGSAANNVVYTRNFFIGYLILPQDQQILAIRNVFLLGDEMETIGLDLLDQVGHVEADMSQRPPFRHRLLALVVLHRHEFAAGLERSMDGGQHLFGVIEVMVDVESEHDVYPGFGQFGVGFRAFDEGHVFQLQVFGPLFRGGQEIVENIFRDHAARSEERRVGK